MIKQPYYIRYSTEVPKSPISGSLDGANLAYVAVPQLDPATPTGNIAITDLSYTFPENTIMFANQVTQFSNNLGNSTTSNVLITNVYSGSTGLGSIVATNNSIPVTPLWYQYNFLADAPISQNSNGTFTVTLIDNNGNIVPSYHMIFNYNNAGTPIGIYTDIINTLETYYWVVYLSEGIQVQKLLSCQPIFTVVQSLGPGNNYIIQYNSNLNIYQILTNGQPDWTYSILNIGTTKISIQNPVQASNIDPWYVRITNGSFQRYVGTNTYQYGLPEYYTQPYTPFSPAMYQINESPIFISNNLIQLRQIPLLPPGTILNDVVVYINYSEDRSNLANSSITTAGGIVDLMPESPNNPVILSKIWYTLQIEDIDRTTGLCKISDILLPSPDGINYGTSLSQQTGIPTDGQIYTNDVLTAFYYYDEIDYIFNKISLNPLFDQQLLNDGVSIYITPAISTVNGVQTTLPSVSNYLRFDQNENITDSSDPSVSIGTSLSSFYSLPSNSNLLELGQIFIRNTATLTQITGSNLIDTRIIGGQLMPLDSTNGQEIIDTINNNTNDMYELIDWNGQVLPGNSVVIIKLPTYLLNEDYTVNTAMLTGSALSQRMLDLRIICKKHLAYGILPIVRFYDQFGNLDLNLLPALDRNYF